MTNSSGSARENGDRSGLRLLLGCSATRGSSAARTALGSTALASARPPRPAASAAGIATRTTLLAATLAAFPGRPGMTGLGRPALPAMRMSLVMLRRL